MAQPYPRHPNLEGAFAPIHMECEAPDLVIEGAVPKDLFGTFYRAYMMRNAGPVICRFSMPRM